MGCFRVDRIVLFHGTSHDNVYGIPCLLHSILLHTSFVPGLVRG